MHAFRLFAVILFTVAMISKTEVQSAPQPIDAATVAKFWSNTNEQIRHSGNISAIVKVIEENIEMAKASGILNEADAPAKTQSLILENLSSYANYIHPKELHPLIELYMGRVFVEINPADFAAQTMSDDRISFEKIGQLQLSAFLHYVARLDELIKRNGTEDKFEPLKTALVRYQFREPRKLSSGDVELLGKISNRELEKSLLFRTNINGTQVTDRAGVDAFQVYGHDLAHGGSLRRTWHFFLRPTAATAVLGAVSLLAAKHYLRIPDTDVTNLVTTSAGAFVGGFLGCINSLRKVTSANALEARH